MKNIIYLFLIPLVFSACTNDVQTNNPAFQAKFNDATWRANDARVSIDGEGRFVITAYTQYETVVLRTSSPDLGTYTLGTTNQDNYVSYDFDGQGIFSSHDTSLNLGPAYAISNIVNSGTGYTNSNNSQTTPVTGSGSGLKLAIETNATNGSITRVSIVSRGDGYVAGDLVSVIGGDNNATVRVLNTQQSNGEIVIEEIDNDKYTGTFKFNAVSDSGEVITFSNGVFYRVSAAGL